MYFVQCPGAWTLDWVTYYLLGLLRLTSCESRGRDGRCYKIKLKCTGYRTKKPKGTISISACRLVVPTAWRLALPGPWCQLVSGDWRPRDSPVLVAGGLQAGVSPHESRVTSHACVSMLGLVWSLVFGGLLGPREVRLSHHE